VIRTALGILAVVPAVATPYFVIFWTWFGFWRRHVALVYAMILGALAGTALAAFLLRDAMLAPVVALPAPVRAIGWALVATAMVIGTVADRQIGFRVRSFMPFFEPHPQPLALVTSGAYAIVRHPIYATGIAFQLGAFLATGYLAVAVAAAVFAAGAAWFTRREERHLRELLPDPSAYDAYAARVPRLLPWPRP
jgi:protein-S-isoprenylcysteine O-methyltransferase Ste14